MAPAPVVSWQGLVAPIRPRIRALTSGNPVPAATSLRGAATAALMVPSIAYQLTANSLIHSTVHKVISGQTQATDPSATRGQFYLLRPNLRARTVDLSANSQLSLSKALDADSPPPLGCREVSAARRKPIGRGAANKSASKSVWQGESCRCVLRMGSVSYTHLR